MCGRGGRWETVSFLWITAVHLGMKYSLGLAKPPPPVPPFPSGQCTGRPAPEPGKAKACAGAAGPEPQPPATGVNVRQVWTISGCGSAAGGLLDLSHKRHCCVCSSPLPSPPFPMLSVVQAQPADSALFTSDLTGSNWI